MKAISGDNPIVLVSFVEKILGLKKIKGAGRHFFVDTEFFEDVKLLRCLVLRAFVVTRKFQAPNTTVPEVFVIRRHLTWA